MYLKFFNLITKPFEITPDPRFLWLGEKHKEGFLILRYGITTGTGFIALTGGAGTGKTTLLDALAKSFGDNFIFARIPDPSLEELDFLNYTARAFGLDKKFSAKSDYLFELTTFLKQADARKKEVVLVVDEAHKIKEALLEEVRLISNIEKPEKKLITILFAGQNRFNEMLDNNIALRNSLAINYKIEALTDVETEEYITHRLKIAGAKSRIFSSQAIYEIYLFTKGNPRQINIICDLALLAGYKVGTKKIEPAIIKECVRKTSSPFAPIEPVTENQILPTKITRKQGQAKLAEDVNRSSIISRLQKKKSVGQGKTAYFVAIPALLLIGIIGSVYYTGVYNSSILKLKTYFKQAVSNYVNPASDALVHNAQAVKVPVPLQSEPKLKESEKNRQPKKNSNLTLYAELADKTAQNPDHQKELEAAWAERDALAAQLEEITSQNSDYQNELETVRSERDALAAQLEELEEQASQNSDYQDELESARAERDALAAQLEELEEHTAQISDYQDELETARAEREAIEAQLQKSRQETDLLKAQLKELGTQKTSSESRIDELQTAYNALLADFEELNNTKEQVADIKNALTVKDRLLTQSEQRQQELENKLAQEKDSKEKLGSELSMQAARVEDLQNKLESARADLSALKDEIDTSVKKNAQLQAQVQKLKAKTPESPDKPAAMDSQKKFPSETKLPETRTEAPNPTDIIDWVLKKKSE